MKETAKAPPSVLVARSNPERFELATNPKTMEKKNAVAKNSPNAARINPDLIILVPVVDEVLPGPYNGRDPFFPFNILLNFLAADGVLMVKKNKF